MKTINIYKAFIDKSSLMNPLVRTFKHSAKHYDRDMHASKTYGNSPSN